MAGTKTKDNFKELVSPFLKSKFIDLENYSENLAKSEKALEKQYLQNKLER